MKKSIFISVVIGMLLVAGSPVFAQTQNPFHLPAGLPTPMWVQLTDWSQPNVRKIDSLIAIYHNDKEKENKEQESALGLRKGSEEEREFNEDPYFTAYTRWRNKMAPFVQPDGSIKYNAAYVRQQLQHSIDEQKKTAAQGRTERTTSASNWTLLGPVMTYNDNGGGVKNWQSNVYCMAIAPSNPSVLYASTEPGTMFRSADKGLHWVSVSDSLYSCQASTIAIDPTNANILYCYDAMSAAILKTTDGGTTWSIDSAYTGGGGDRMVIAPGSGRILITGDSAIYYSDNSGVTWSSTTGTAGMTDIALDPNNVDTIYAAGASATGYLKLMRSVDGGAHFTDVTGGLSWINTGGARLGVTPANSSYVYCINIGGTSAARIIKTTDRGATWAIMVTSVDSTSLTGNGDTTGLGMSNGQGYYDLDIVVSPRDANSVIVGTTSTYKSTDGGSNFRPLGGYVGNFGIHPDLQQAVANDTDVYLATDGGVNHSSDFFTEPANWSVRDNEIRSGDFWGFGQGWDEDVVVGGRYHNGDVALFENYGTGNALALGGGESATGHVFHGHSRTTGFNDIGTLVLPTTLAQSIQYGAPAVPNTLWPQDDYYGLFSSRLVIDPRYSNVFYLGSDSLLWKSTNSGASYTALLSFGTGNKVWRFDIARSNYNVIYVCANHGVYKSIDAGATWTGLTIPATYQYYNSDIVVDPLNENNVYLCMAEGAAADKVFMSTTGGTSWTNITGTVLNNQPVAFLQFQGGTNGGVYAITNNRPSKVYYRDNTMTDWVAFSNGLPGGLEAREGGIIFYRDSKMRLAGNSSIWETPLYSTGTPVAQPMADKQYIGCTSDTVNFYDYSMYNYAGATRLWTFTGASWVSSDTARMPKVTYPAPGSYNVALQVTNAGGASNTRTVNNMITFDNDLCGPDTVAGLCVQLNGTGQTIDLGNVNINSNTFSISCWIQPKGNQSSFSQIISHDVYPGSGGYGFGMGFTFAGYTPNLELCYTDSTVNYSSYSGLICDSTKWNFVVLTYAPTGVTMYLNGVAASVNTGTMPVIDLSQTPFYLDFDAQEGQGSRYNGKVDEVKFYNYTLSQSEVREKMHLIQSNPASEPGLLKYFQFNQYELTSGLLHDAFATYNTEVPGANIVKSTAPVATGTVYRNTAVNSAGLNSFPAADASLYLPAGGTYPNGEMVAFHLWSNPDTMPDERHVVPGYFVINNYGADTSFTQPDSILLSNLKINSALYPAGSFGLYKRPSGAFGNTWGTELDTASSFSYAINHSSLTFTAHNNVTSLFSQLLVVNSDTASLGINTLTTTSDQWHISQLYPDPVTEWCKVMIHAPLAAAYNATLTLTDITGTQLLRIPQPLDRQDNEVMIHLPKLASGNYLLHIEVPGQVSVVRKFVVE